MLKIEENRKIKTSQLRGIKVKRYNRLAMSANVNNLVNGVSVNDLIKLSCAPEGDQFRLKVVRNNDRFR